MNEWIDFNKQRPPANSEILVTVNVGRKKTVLSATYEVDKLGEYIEYHTLDTRVHGGKLNSVSRPTKCIAWMQLPEAYNADVS